MWLYVFPCRTQDKAHLSVRGTHVFFSNQYWNNNVLTVQRHWLNIHKFMLNREINKRPMLWFATIAFWTIGSHKHSRVYMIQEFFLRALTSFISLSIQNVHNTWLVDDIILNWPLSSFFDCIFWSCMKAGLI